MDLNLKKHREDLIFLPLGGANEILSSFVNNSEKKIINADLRECLVYRGKFTLASHIDKSTTVIKK